MFLGTSSVASTDSVSLGIPAQRSLLPGRLGKEKSGRKKERHEEKTLENHNFLGTTIVFRGVVFLVFSVISDNYW